jgi:MarR family transcriptional regulator, organic hydroperoxide resistance regulator
MQRRPRAANKEHANIRFQPAISVSHEAMLVDGTDETFRHVLFLARLTADRLATFRETIARLIGLSGNQYAILLAIAHAPGKAGVTVRDVARYTLMASTHVTTQVGALHRKNLVCKRPNGQDGRSVLLSLTPKGEKAMKFIGPLRQEFNDAFFVGMSRASLLAAAEFLEKVAVNSERALPLLSRTTDIAGDPQLWKIKARGLSR